MILNELLNRAKFQGLHFKFGEINPALAFLLLRVVLHQVDRNKDRGFPGGSVGEESPDKAGHAGDAGSTIPGNPLQYSCLE